MKSLVKSAALTGVAFVVASAAQEAVPTMTNEEASSIRGLFFPGPKSNPVPMEEMDAVAMDGTWYEIGASLYPKLTFEMGCSCTRSTWAASEEDAAINIEYDCERSGFSSFFPGLGNQVNGRFYPSGAVVWPIMSPAKGIMEMRTPEFVPPAGTPPNLMVIYTEPEVEPEYMITASPQTYFTNVWIMSKNREVTNEKFEELKGHAMARGISAQEMRWPFFSATRQTNCSDAMRDDAQTQAVEEPTAVVTEYVEEPTFVEVATTDVV